MVMTADEWVSSFAELVGIAEPSPEEVEALLALAGVAAHASERTAAPLACWLAARAGCTLAAALELARSLDPELPEG